MSIWHGLREGAATHARTALGAALDAFLPRRCLLCARPCHEYGEPGQSALCAGCADSLPRLPQARCPVCAHPLAGVSVTGLPCGQCLANPPAFDATLAGYAYQAPIDDLIQSLKYRSRTPFGAFHLASADFLGQELRAVFLLHSPLPPIDRLLPMPLAPRRLAERGFNQAVELARPLARSVPYSLELSAVTRTRETIPQVQLPWNERATNIRNAFACSANLSGEHVLVIDDVMTTGATLNELARVLKKRGAARVTNLIVARTLRH